MPGARRPQLATAGRAIFLVAFLATLLGVPFSLHGRTANEPGTPIVLLVSFDGWRSDYMQRDRAHTPNLRALAARGVRGELIPAFPPKTFPNHYTIVTGLYPAHHGIVSNAIADPAFPERFTMSAETATDPRWWGGEPIWITAMRQGRRAASMFWPGSEARGRQPTYWRPFNDEVPNGERVDQVLAWLSLPEAERPSLITLYFSEVDHAGHDFGPTSSEVMDATAHLDAALGDLIAGVSRLHLLDRTTFVIVSDHGMSELSPSRVIFLDDYLDLSTVDIVDWSPNLGLTPRSISLDQAYNALRGKHPALTVFTRDQIPAALHYRDNPRIPPLVGLAADGWTITSHQRFAERLTTGHVLHGEHGYDPKYASMRGLFVAAGPRIRRGRVTGSLENVHVYDFLCELLGLTPAPNDGNRKAIGGFLQK